ncbi:Putative transferase CAF17, mitochondrial [Strongyloides ratti]|uniref:Putative transferase CAF17, mitochondrial n=1 Tax=Strongyloides ratti TaxID=34506 RepID=A0A090MXM2_STRRB|nr:Putative transferase CAF17, mitochondrial [Strongyloides ratti]CEF65679.1 Putative transferase CAF17, mitochondrial [Strongyloides ratti]
MLQSYLLPFRKLISIKGSESFSFLQALLTKDLRKLDKTNNGIEFSFLLNSRGRIVTDLLVYKVEDEFLLEMDHTIVQRMLKLLNLYKIRRNVIITDSDKNVNFTVEQINDNPNAYKDPRTNTFGTRILSNKDVDVNINKDEEKNYHLRRMVFGIPEGNFETENELPLNMNGDLMNGINFDKGCYVGQELTARTNFVGVVRKRLLPLKFESKLVSDSTQLFDENNKRIGKLIKRIDNLGIGIVAIDKIDKEIVCNHEKVFVLKPEWWKN